jgi:hypothetical protein
MSSVGEGDPGRTSCIALHMPIASLFPNFLAHQNSSPARSISTVQCMRISRAMGSEALTATVKSGPAPPGNTKQNPRSNPRCSSAKHCFRSPIAVVHGFAGATEDVEAVSLNGIVVTLSSSLGVSPRYWAVWYKSLRFSRRASAVPVSGCSTMADASP